MLQDRGAGRTDLSLLATKYSFLLYWRPWTSGSSSLLVSPVQYTSCPFSSATREFYNINKSNFIHIKLLYSFRLKFSHVFLVVSTGVEEEELSLGENSQPVLNQSQFLIFPHNSNIQSETIALMTSCIKMNITLNNLATITTTAYIWSP